MSDQFDPTRRRLLAASALAVTGLVFDDACAQPLSPTPQCHDGDDPTVRQTEGPYFKPSSPQRADLCARGQGRAPSRRSGARSGNRLG